MIQQNLRKKIMCKLLKRLGKMKKNSLYKIIRFFLILILIHSCTSNNQEVIKNENGNICMKCELKNGVRNGKCYEYYPNGDIYVISSWIAGVQNGKKIVYFENGTIKETSIWEDGNLEGEVIEYSGKGYVHKVKQYMNGKPDGLWIHFFEGYPMRAMQYVIVKDYQEYLNQWWVYDYFGDVKKEESHYYSIYSEKGDSIKAGVAGVLKVKLEAPVFGGYMKLVTGNFDNKFNPIDATKLDTINCVGFEGTVKYKFDEIGTHFVQGIILDAKKGKGYDEKGEYTETKQREIYFIRTIEVY